MLFRLLVLAVSLVLVSRANAGYPTLYYHPETGNARLFNDPSPFSHTDRIIVQSFQKRLIAPPEGLIPGATYGLGSMPEVISFINVPAGNFELGMLLQPHAPTSDLGISYLPGLHGIPLSGAIVEIPEPATFVMAASLFGLVFVRRAGVSASTNKSVSLAA